MLTVKVLGPGCANCRRVEQIARKAAADLALEVEFVKVTEYADIMQYPILSTPGLVVEGEVVSSGRVPSAAEVTTWLVDAVERSSAPT